jgi:putative transcriptional regulator
LIERSKIISDTALGRRLWELREERGWSQAETASRAGISHPTIMHLEGGRTTPRLTTLRRLARLFDVSVEELQQGDEKNPLVLSTEEMYVLDKDERRALLRQATSEAIADYAHEIDTIIHDLLTTSPGVGPEILAPAKSEDEHRILWQQRESIWRHVRRFVTLRDEASAAHPADVAEPPETKLPDLIASSSIPNPGDFRRR